jgi:type IV fimbrial biogenesis protein FimT
MAGFSYTINELNVRTSAFAGTGNSGADARRAAPLRSVRVACAVRRRLQQGLSIIEILVTLAIIGMLMALAGPSAGVWIRHAAAQRRRPVVSGLSRPSRGAQAQQAVMTPLTTPFDGDICLYDYVTDACSTAPGAILFSKSKNEASYNARVATEINAAPNTATALTAGTGVPATFTFDPFGRQAATAANNFTRIDIRNTTLSAANERRLVILINAAGQIRMCDPKLSKATNPQGCV